MAIITMKIVILTKQCKQLRKIQFSFPNYKKILIPSLSFDVLVLKKIYDIDILYMYIYHNA